MDITVNEWLFHYLIDEEKYSIADEILSNIYEKCDRLVYAKDSPMHRKIWKLSAFKLPKQRDVVKNFFRKFYPYNSDKTLLMEKNNLQNLPDEIINILPHKEREEDIYLLQACMTTDDKIILTTDEDFKKAIHNKLGIRVKLVSEFLEEVRNARK